MPPLLKATTPKLRPRKRASRGLAVVVVVLAVSPEVPPVAPPRLALEDELDPDVREEEEVSPPHPEKNTTDESNKHDMTSASNLPPFILSSIHDVIIRPTFH